MSGVKAPADYPKYERAACAEAAGKKQSIFDQLTRTEKAVSLPWLKLGVSSAAIPMTDRCLDMLKGYSSTKEKYRYLWATRLRQLLAAERAAQCPPLAAKPLGLSIGMLGEAKPQLPSAKR